MSDTTTPLTEIIGHHLVYELGMLEGTFIRIFNGGSDPVVRNALIEAFAIHARTLVKFFESGDHTDLSRFMIDGYQAKFVSAVSASLTRINQQIAHLTLRRTSDVGEKLNVIDFARIVGAVVQEVENFRAGLRPEFVPVFSYTPLIKNLTIEQHGNDSRISFELRVSVDETKAPLSGW